MEICPECRVIARVTSGSTSMRLAHSGHLCWTEAFPLTAIKSYDAEVPQLHNV